MTQDSVYRGSKSYLGIELSPNSVGAPYTCQMRIYFKTGNKIKNVKFFKTVEAISLE